VHFFVGDALLELGDLAFEALGVLVDAEARLLETGQLAAELSVGGLGRVLGLLGLGARLPLGLDALRQLVVLPLNLARCQAATVSATSNLNSLHALLHEDVAQF
jgi:hypothetical protein